MMIKFGHDMLKNNELDPEMLEEYDFTKRGARQGCGAIWEVRQRGGA